MRASERTGWQLWADFADVMAYSPEDVENGRRVAMALAAKFVPADERAAALAALSRYYIIR